MTSKYIPIALTMICLFCIPPLAESKICYVSKIGSSNGPGDSWSTAFDDFATAIQSIQPEDSIFMAEGIYYLPSESVIIKYGIRLFGGFAGWESYLDERIPGLHETIIKGGEYYVKIELDSIYYRSILDRMTFSDGNAQFEKDECSYPEVFCAGGILLINKANGTLLRDITLRDCTFKNNRAHHGGAIAIYNFNESTSSFLFKRCIFENNLAVEWSGGAVYFGNSINSNSKLKFDSCNFSNNRTLVGYGGAVYYFRRDNSIDSVVFNNCFFSNNKCLLSGGGGSIAFQNNGLINVEDFLITNCSFNGNIANQYFPHQAWIGGSALRLVKGGTVRNCIFYENRSNNSSVLTGYGMTIEQSLFVNNQSGGDASILVVGESQPLGQLVFHNKFKNCTFYNNKAMNSLPLFYRSYPRLQDTILNCVFINNSNFDSTPVFVSRWGADENNRLYANHIGGDVSPESFYAMLDSTGTSEFEPDECTWFHGDPMFVDTAGGDFRLRRCSPMINKGHNAFVTWDTDLSGAVRIQEDTVDLGAYERLRFMPEIDLLSATCAHDPDGAVLLEQGGYTPPANWHIYNHMGINHTHDRLSPGSYMATLIDGEQCERIFTIDIAGPDTIQAFFSISGTTEGNASGSIVIDTILGGNPAYTIEWFDGSGGLSIEDLTSGLYTLTITDNGGCTRVWEIEVPLINSLDPPYASGQFTYNNPARGVLMYNWKTAIPQDVTYHFKDIRGNEVLSGSIYTGTGEIPLPTVSTGFYYLILNTESGSVQYPVIVIK